MNKFSQKSVTGKVYKEIIKDSLILSGEKIAVAVSGGADSICLLSVLLELKDKLGIQISAVHFNHRLRGSESDMDEKFVADFCRERGIDCIVDRAKKINSYKSEDEARIARYAFFQNLLAGERADKVAIAHNQNDQAETVLLRLIRGSGFSGLKAIPRVREKFIRPLLTISRPEIEKYLADRNIRFRTDDSNSDIIYSRNYIRHQILPQISKINPNVVATLAGSAEIFADDYNYLEETARATLTTLRSENRSDLVTLDHKSWQALPLALQRLTLRLSVAEISDLTDITFKQIDEVMAVLRRGRGKKWKPLPHSLRISLVRGKIRVEKLNK
ncbi:tRNA lysidine(34) synthetase TilS [Candidatus Berkelbacteria bacterium CG10_big_fil_rev_8_21_14_0_10_43_13]|uniref:tRNA(Ile)-lysidine synthase n=1 Tax=Candidatus Berkelbacteria bacterium CG10_big_fil_rev_8_21_14_0_10_43_13 TaxID=1974514 RepID=A0A2H0W5M7_9BACT|nr:MAG: tRNA lysidine(34) synthetase TilS [Candidatus Berkelbacteria bacterium CG10_big_fil_rev_8_21_14_0_10_43_13]